MKVRFWGVRGSYPVPGPTTNRYGGNTACLQVLPEDGTLLCIDAGTGIRRLGQSLMAGPAGRGEAVCHLLISHTHWDHIQGLPFFAPLYVRGNELCIYGRQRDVHLKTLFDHQTDEPFFSLRLDEVAASVRYLELIEGTQFSIGQTEVRCALLNHPGLALGYRLEADGHSIAYISDTAPFDQILFKQEFIGSPPEAPPSAADASELLMLRDGVLSLCQDCDLVVYDTMFLPEEYRAFPHFGHSTAEHALELTAEAGARAVALFHHSPRMDDAQLDRLLDDLRGRTTIEVVGASEGLELDLGRCER